MRAFSPMTTLAIFLALFLGCSSNQAGEQAFKAGAALSQPEAPGGDGGDSAGEADGDEEDEEDGGPTLPTAFSELATRFEFTCPAPSFVFKTPHEVKVGEVAFRIEGSRILQVPAVDGPLRLGVIGAPKDDTPETRENLKVANVHFEKAGVHAVIVPGDLAENTDLKRVIRMLAEVFAQPLFILSGNIEWPGTFNAAYSDVQKEHGHLFNMNWFHHVDFGGVHLLALPGYFEKRFSRSGACAYTIRFERAWLALGILALLIGLLTTQVIHPVAAVLVCAMAMIGSRCVTGTIARNSVDLRVLLVIGAALGMGAALDETGAAVAIADALISVAEMAGLAGNPHAMFFVLFIITALFAQLITNNGAAVLMFPMVIETSGLLGVDSKPFVIGLMIAAGSSFISPFAYQTNLMVYGPGGYRFIDFVKMGLPLTIVLAIVTTLVTPLAFPFG
jgi:hypothetical protein